MTTERPAILDLRARLARLYPGFRAAEVARRCGVSERSYRRWEAGIAAPSNRHRRALDHEVRDRDEALRMLDALEGRYL